MNMQNSIESSPISDAAASGLEVENNRKIQAIMRQIQERKAKTICGLSGLIVLLPMMAHAQSASAEPVALDNVENVVSYAVQPDGTAKVTLSNGQTVIVDAASVSVASDGSVMVSSLAATELTAAGEVAYGVGDVPPEVLAMAAGGVGLLAVAAGGSSSSGDSGGGGGTDGGGDGGGDGGDGSTAISKTLQIVDAPLHNALVFYDIDLDGNADESEYLGLTDANGAVNVTYTPVAGAKFIIVPSPAGSGDNSYGWSDSFASQFDDVTTRDIATGNIFSNVLEAEDTGVAGGQVVSPISTLKAAGMTEAQIKAVFNIPADTNLTTFNFYEQLTSSDPAIRATAQKMSAAAVIATKVIDAAVAAADANSSGGLTAAQKQAVASKAATDIGKVLKDLPAGTSLSEATEAASAVAVAGALDSTLDTTAMASSVSSAMAGGSNAATAVSNTVSALQLSSSISATVNSVSQVIKTSATQIETLFNNLTESGPSADFNTQLDNATDDITSGVAEGINKELLGVVLTKDTNTAIENQLAFVKGNLLANDHFSTGELLPATTGIYSVNGTKVAGLSTQEGAGIYYISSSDWASISGNRTVSDSVIEDAINLDGDLPAATTGGSATRGSAITKTLTGVEAGDTLTFDYIFGSYDYLPYNDYSYVAIQQVDGSGNPIGAGIVLRGTGADGTYDVQDLKGPLNYTLAGQWSQSATQQFSYTFDAGGTYNIAIGVTDVRDTIVDSAMLVSDIQLESGGETIAIQLTDFAAYGNAATIFEVPNSVNALVATGKYGTLIVTKAGDYLYQVSTSNADPIPEGAVVTDDFTYTVVLADGRRATQSLSIKVTGVADPVDSQPLIGVLDSPVNAAASTAAPIIGLTTNVAEGTSVSITITNAGGETVATGTATVDANGAFSTEIDLSGVDDGALTISVSVTANGFTETSTSALELDTTADVNGDLSVVLLTGTDAPDLSFTDNGGLPLQVSGLDSDASGVLTLSNGTITSTFEFTLDGSYTIDTSAFAAGDVLTGSIVVTDNVGNEVSDPEALTFTVPAIPTVINTTTNMGYTSLAEALDAANANDVLQLAAGTFDEDIVLYKAVTILGANADIAAWTDAAGLDPDGGSGARGAESIITGTVTVAASNVTINGVSLDNGTAPLSWAEGILTSTPGGLDNFTLSNSIITGYDASGAPTFNANSDAQRGLYTGDAVADGWVISGNLIGGVLNGNAGTLYLSGLSNSEISDNMFWRPTAGHLYVSSLTDTDISGNFFYHGLHSGGADFDGFGDYYDGEGYGYGYGYGAAEDFFGRNFWIELKGTNDGVIITDNDGKYNSGGIQIFGENEGYSFTNITISGNNFQDFINADPTGVLAGNGKSGFMGAIVVSVGEGSTAEGIVITANTISAAVDQVYSARDQSSLIVVQGIVDGVTVTQNILTWTTSDPELLSALTAMEIPSSTFDTSFAGVLLAGGIDGEVVLNGNDFNFSAESAKNPIAFYALGEIEGFEGFGIFAASIVESANDYANWNNGLSVLFDNVSGSYDIDTAIFDTTSLYLRTDNGFYALQLGGSGSTALSGTSSSDAIYSGAGNDAVDILQGGKDIILINANPAANGEDLITGFSLGDDAQSDYVALVNFDQSSLRGSGELMQMITSGSEAVNANSGLLIFSNEITATADQESDALAGVLSGLSGLIEGDEFYVLADFSTTDLIFGHVTVGAGGAIFETVGMAEFNGLSAADLPGMSQYTFDDFTMALPEV